MSRLYYPPTAGSRLASGQASTGEVTKDNLEKVVKLVPAELITGYSALISAAANFHDAIARNIGFAISFVLCGVLTPIYLNKMAEAGKPKIVHLVVSTLAFVVWAYYTSGRQVIPQYFNGDYALFGLLVFSLITAVTPLKK